VDILKIAFSHGVIGSSRIGIALFFTGRKYQGYCGSHENAGMGE
jgi:hypothetical protein